MDRPVGEPFGWIAEKRPILDFLDHAGSGADEQQGGRGGEDEVDVGRVQVVTPQQFQPGLGNGGREDVLEMGAPRDPPVEVGGAGDDEEGVRANFALISGR